MNVVTPYHDGKPKIQLQHGHFLRLTTAGSVFEVLKRISQENFTFFLVLDCHESNVPSQKESVQEVERPLGRGAAIMSSTTASPAETPLEPSTLSLANADRLEVLARELMKSKLFCLALRQWEKVLSTRLSLQGYGHSQTMSIFEEKEELQQMNAAFQHFRLLYVVLHWLLVLLVLLSVVIAFSDWSGRFESNQEALNIVLQEPMRAPVVSHPFFRVWSNKEGLHE
jgi:hypothetical protein